MAKSTMPANPNKPTNIINANSIRAAGIFPILFASLKIKVIKPDAPADKKLIAQERSLVLD